MSISFGSFALVQSTIQSFTESLSALHSSVNSYAKYISTIARVVYDVIEVPNAVISGKVDFPENKEDLRYGISVEFRCVRRHTSKFD